MCSSAQEELPGPMPAIEEIRSTLDERTRVVPSSCRAPADVYYFRCPSTRSSEKTCRRRPWCMSLSQMQSRYPCRDRHPCRHRAHACLDFQVHPRSRTHASAWVVRRARGLSVHADGRARARPACCTRAALPPLPFAAAREASRDLRSGQGTLAPERCSWTWPPPPRAASSSARSFARHPCPSRTNSPALGRSPRRRASSTR
mmetsp:Transcript_22457/g.55846  ORF Transcript_22457/g.55846 Transcript_22457/m.55846 type:complete len:202 (-) Transcript_22457:274-879(-)